MRVNGSSVIDNLTKIFIFYAHTFTLFIINIFVTNLIMNAILLLLLKCNKILYCNILLVKLLHFYMLLNLPNES